MSESDSGLRKNPVSLEENASLFDAQSNGRFEEGLP
jgi:hypothetical protein